MPQHAPLNMDSPPSQAILSLQAAHSPRLLRLFDGYSGRLGTLVTKSCCDCPAVFQLNQSLAWTAKRVPSAAQVSTGSRALEGTHRQQAPPENVASSGHSLLRGDFKTI